MNNEDQHIVPTDYLKHFGSEFPPNKVFRSKLISHTNKWSNPDLKHISSFCYAGDFYDIHEDFAKKKNVKPDHVERKAFWYEKDFIDDMIEMVENKVSSQELIIKVPDFYLSIIYRNPVFRNALNPEAIRGMIKTEISDVRAKMKPMIDLIENPGLKKEAVDRINSEEEALLSQNTRGCTHSSSMLRQAVEENTAYQVLLNKLRGYKIMCVTIENENEYFITSNVPGVSIDVNGQVHTFIFKDDLSHFIPSPLKLCLF